MERYNPLAVGHLDNGGELENGRRVWVLTEAGRQQKDNVHAYMTRAGYNHGTYHTKAGKNVTGSVYGRE